MVAENRDHERSASFFAYFYGRNVRFRVKSGHSSGRALDPRAPQKGQILYWLVRDALIPHNVFFLQLMDATLSRLNTVRSWKLVRSFGGA